MYMEKSRTRAGFVSQIFIKMPDGSSLTLDVVNSYRIKVVKNMIKNVTTIPRCEQRLRRLDKLLEDHITLRDHGIEKAASLTLSLGIEGRGKRVEE